MKRPLDACRVLDFSRYLPGAYFGWIAGDMGADVIRIEHPRELAKHEQMFGRVDEDAAARRHRARPTYTRNKRSIVLNPGHKEARPVLEALIASADVLVEDYRPGTMAAMGLGYEEVSAINPRMVYASVSFAGQCGPLSKRTGHDPAALAAAGVLSQLNGLATPSLPGVQVADVMAGTHATIAILLALQARNANDLGSHVDVAMIDAAMPLLMVALGRAEDPAAIPSPNGSWHPKGGVWRCADGLWLCTTDMEPRYWARFCKVIGHAEWIERQLDSAAYPEMHAELKTLFATRSRSDWMGLFQQADTQAMPVLSPAEALRDANTIARDMRVSLSVDDAGTVEQIGTPFRISQVETQQHRACHLPGADRDAVLAEIGFDAPEIARLEATGLFTSREGGAA